jgi:hypothetical protein
MKAAPRAVQGRDLSRAHQAREDAEEDREENRKHEQSPFFEEFEPAHTGLLFLLLLDLSNLS